MSEDARGRHVANKIGFAPVTDEEYEICQRVTHNIKRLCKAAHIPETHCERSAGFQIGFIPGHRNFRRRIEREDVEKLADFFNLTADELMYQNLDTEHMEITYKVPWQRPKRKHLIPVNPKICRKCKYRASDHGLGICDYLLIAHKMRPHSEWDNCPTFEPGKRLREDTRITVSRKGGRPRKKREDK